MQYLSIVPLLIWMLLCTPGSFAQVKPKSSTTLKQASVTEWVDPLFGVDGGNTMPGATLPFGLVKLGPDVKPPYGTNGYNSNNPIEGFSHTHLSGTGGGGRYGNVLVIPQVGTVTPKEAYNEKINEYASPGYYTATLQRKPGDVIAELTATPHSGLHKYRFYTWDKRKSFKANILIDASHVIGRAKGAKGGSTCTESEVHFYGQNMEGYGRFEGGWGGKNPYTVYFSAALNMPYSEFGTYEDTLVKPGATTSTGTKSGVYVSFMVNQMQPVLLKVGISLVSQENARKNREECPNWDFELTRLKADSTWNQFLGKVQLQGGSPEQKKLFYTYLYHTALLPTDVSGPENPNWKTDEPAFWDHYCLWDVFRSVMPLHTLIAPQTQTRIVNSLLDIYRHKQWLPDAWVAGNFGMVQGGSNADVVLADAIAKGLPINVKLAWEAVKKNTETESDNPEKYGRELTDYTRIGYVPSEVKCGSSKTLEYAFNDYCAASVAKAAGDLSTSEKLLKRSDNCFNLFNPDTRFFWARDRTGKWAPDFSPTFILPNSWDGPYFYEGDPWMYSTYVPHNMQGLINRHGGPEKFTAFLDTLFEGNHYKLENEPVFLVPYQYNYALRPDKTATRVRAALANRYNLGRKGLPGQDDSGAISSWYVFGAMGFFPVAGTDVYLLGSPLFNEIDITLENGKYFKIVAKNNSAVNKYIQKASLNGKPFNQNWFRHPDIIEGGTLVLQMGPKPSIWGKKIAPPSLSR
jgi:predicted alpha-1,2-mannosidase